MRFTMNRYAACIVLTLMVSAALEGAARAAVLVDINADGTARIATNAHFEAAAGLAAGTFAADMVSHFDLNGPDVASLAFDQTVDDIRIQATSTISTIAGDADGWFGAGSNNNLLEDGLFVRHTGQDPSGTLTLSGSGLGLAADRRYQLFLFAGRNQGHETTFTFDVNDPEDPTGGTAIHTDPPVVGGDNTPGTAQFTFETGTNAPASLVIQWDGAQHSDGNQDACFSGFALREIGTVAYWQLDDASGDLVDVVTHDGAAQTLTGGTGLTYLQPNVAPDFVTNPDAGPFTLGTTNDNPNSIDFAGASIAPKTTNAAPFKLTTASSFTFEGWLKTTATSGVIAGDRHNSTGWNGWYCLMIGGGKVRFFFSTGTVAQIDSTSAVNDSSPHHFAAVWDHAAGEMRLYIDGDLEGTANPTVGSYTQSAGFGIGGRATAGDNIFDDNIFQGRLDELRFSNVALSPSESLSSTGPDMDPPEIATLSPANNATGVSPRADLVARFDEVIVTNTTGSIVISNRSDHSIATIAIGDTSQITVSGTRLTINPTDDLDTNTQYAVLIDTNALKDTSDNVFAGIPAATNWWFETGELTAVLADINADGTDRTASTADFEDAAGLAAGTFSRDSVIVFGGTEESGTYAETKNDVTLAISGKSGGADGWFGAGADNNLLDDGFFNSGTTLQTITISGSGLGLVANRRYELYLFAGRSLGHATTFTFDANHPEDPSSGASIPAGVPVVGGDETLGTVLFTFNTGATPPSSLAIDWTGQGADPNAAVFAGFAFRDIGEPVADADAPEIASLSPTNNATGVSPKADLVVRFDEVIETNTTGSVVISNRNNSATTAIAIGDTSQVTVSGNRLTVIPSDDLDNDTPYAVMIDTNALKDRSDNFFAGITNATTWAFQTTPPAPPTMLLHNWTFDTDLVDVIGGKDATAFGDAHFQTASSKIGAGAASFDGSGDYMTAGTASDFVIGTSVKSVSFWFKGAYEASDRMLATGATTDSQSGWAVFQNTAAFAPAMGDGSSSRIIGATPAATPYDGQWHLAVFVFDATTDTVTGYLDAVPRTPATGAAGPIVNTFPLYFGTRAGAGSLYMNGLLDDVAIWDGVLTQADVDRLWNNGDGRAAAVPSTKGTLLIIR